MRIFAAVQANTGLPDLIPLGEPWTPTEVIQWQPDLSIYNALGAVGTGKTYLATALGVKACTMGKKVRFFRLSDLAVELREKYRAEDLTKMTKKLQQLDLLILDEVGYIPCDKLSSQLLFNVISNSYEQQSIIVTSNLQLGRWYEMFGDDRLTAALIDRLIHRTHILSFTGSSLRYEEALKNKPLSK